MFSALPVFASPDGSATASGSHIQPFPESSSFIVYNKPFSVSYRFPNGNKISRRIEYEIAKRTVAFSKGNLHIEHNGHVATPVFEQTESKTVVTFSGDYTASEVRFPDGIIQKSGTRTLKIIETRVWNSGQYLAHHQLIHEFEYKIENDHEHLISHRESIYRTSQTFQNNAQAGDPQKAPLTQAPRTTHALVKNTFKTFDSQGNLLKISRDQQTRETLFNEDGGALLDKIENIFSSNDAADPAARVETHYQRETEYQEDNNPRNMRVVQKTLSPFKNRTVRTSLQWSSAGNLESARVEEFDGRKNMADKAWSRSRTFKTSKSIGANTLTDSGVVQLAKLIKSWEENFVNNGLPSSPYAFPFLVL
jgi:hypothetical protein